jgi:hypothetical protein
MIDVESRFMAKVNKQARVNKHKSGCWLWTASIRSKKGYGQFAVRQNGKQFNWQAHRFAYAHFIGKIPEGKFVLHNCDTPACVNPEHLFLGTHQENVDDMMKKGRKRTKPCKGSSNGRSKLNEEIVADIKTYSSDYSNKALAEIFDVSHHTISLIRLGKTWKHVQPAQERDIA